jgi:hypothetical protein
MYLNLDVRQYITRFLGPLELAVLRSTSKDFAFIVPQRVSVYTAAKSMSLLYWVVENNMGIPATNNLIAASKRSVDLETDFILYRGHYISKSYVVEILAGALNMSPDFMIHVYEDMGKPQLAGFKKQIVNHACMRAACVYSLKFMFRKNILSPFLLEHREIAALSCDYAKNRPFLVDYMSTIQYSRKDFKIVLKHMYSMKAPPRAYAFVTELWSADESEQERILNKIIIGDFVSTAKLTPELLQTIFAISNNRTINLIMREAMKCGNFELTANIMDKYSLEAPPELYAYYARHGALTSLKPHKSDHNYWRIVIQSNSLKNVIAYSLATDSMPDNASIRKIVHFGGTQAAEWLLLNGCDPYYLWIYSACQGQKAVLIYLLNSPLAPPKGVLYMLAKYNHHNTMIWWIETTNPPIPNNVVRQMYLNNNYVALEK